MSRKIGVWIDHRKATVVILEDGSVEVRLVPSELEKRVRMAGGSRPSTRYGPQEIASESSRDRRYAGHLRKYYEAVLAHVKEASCILVFGPGEAKQEFVATLASSSHFRDTAIETEAADKLTKNQIIAHVRRHFRD